MSSLCSSPQLRGRGKRRRKKRMRKRKKVAVKYSIYKAKRKSSGPINVY